MKHKPLVTILALLVLVLVLVGCSGSQDSASRVFFTNIADGDTVNSPVTVQWSAENFIIEPAGQVKEGAGHLHIMIDVPCAPAGEIVPADDNHLHYGKAQTEATLELTPGAHTLCLQAADGIHTALAGDGASQVIAITVR